MIFFKLIIAYDGTNLLGWQKTSMGPSVEGHLEEVFRKIMQQEITLEAASRTDAGVHAEAQVVRLSCRHCTYPLDRLHKSANALLPKQIVIQSIQHCSPNFHPTLDATGKEYHYYICSGMFQNPKHRLTSWHSPSQLNLELMNQLAQEFIGTHNFTTFCNDKLGEKDPICTITSFEVLPIEENRYLFKVIGNRFLFRMVRNMVGTLCYIGNGKMQESISHLLLQKKRAKAGVTAPGEGLHLIQVFYS